VYGILKQAGFFELKVGTPGIVGYIGQQQVVFEESIRYWTDYNLFGVDISKYFHVNYCIFCRQFTFQPVETWRNGDSTFPTNTVKSKEGGESNESNKIEKPHDEL